VTRRDVYHPLRVSTDNLSIFTPVLSPFIPNPQKPQLTVRAVAPSDEPDTLDPVSALVFVPPGMADRKIWLIVQPRVILDDVLKATAGGQVCFT
jgi:hypothetical protein